MIPLYLLFSKEFENILDFSEDMLYELYCSESFGGKCSKNNGYYHGKKWLSVTVSAWREDIEKGYLFPLELYQDPNYPHWWLDSVLSKPYSMLFKQHDLL